MYSCIVNVSYHKGAESVCNGSFCSKSLNQLLRSLDSQTENPDYAHECDNRCALLRIMINYTLIWKRKSLFYCITDGLRDWKVIRNSTCYESIQNQYKKKIENFPLTVVPGMQISSFHFLYTKLSPHSIKSHERVKYTLTKQKISSSKHPSGLPIESIAVMAKFAIFSREPHEKQIIHFSRPKTTKLASSTKLPDPV